MTIIHPIDDRDREAARDARTLMEVKSNIGSEVIVEQLIAHGTDPQTPIPEKLAILDKLNTITAAGERAKRQVTQELGAAEDQRPMLVINIPGRNMTVTAEPALEPEAA